MVVLLHAASPASRWIGAEPPHFVMSEHRPRHDADRGAAVLHDQRLSLPAGGVSARPAPRRCWCRSSSTPSRGLSRRHRPEVLGSCSAPSGPRLLSPLVLLRWRQGVLALIRPRRSTRRRHHDLLAILFLFSSHRYIANKPSGSARPSPGCAERSSHGLLLPRLFLRPPRYRPGRFLSTPATSPLRRRMGGHRVGTLYSASRRPRRPLFPESPFVAISAFGLSRLRQAAPPRGPGLVAACSLGIYGFHASS